MALLVRDPLATRILGVAVASTLAFTVVDFLFKSSVIEAVPPARLGAFFATLGIVLNGAALLVQVIGTGFIMRTLGVHRALWVLPVLLSGGAVFALCGGGLAAALALKGADGALRHSVTRTSTELLYVPIPEARRARVKPLIDLIGQRGGQAAASLAILALVAMGAGSRTFAIAILVLCAAWVAIAATLRRPYLDLFRATLREGRIDVDQERFAELDRETLEALFGALSSSKVPEVLAALDLLERYGRARLVPPLILYHPQKAVVTRALELFASVGEPHFVPIAEWLDGHGDPEIRAAALRARCGIGVDEEVLHKKIGDPSPALKATALVALVARGSLSGDEATRELRKIAVEPHEELRVALARAIRDAGSHARPLEEVLMTMLADASPGVEVEIAAAMGRLGGARFIPELVAMLAKRQPSVAAREALVEIGPEALEALEKALADPATAQEVRAAIPRAIAQFPAEDAARVLTERLANEEDGLVRFRAIRALGRLRDAHPDLPLDTTLLSELATRTLRGAIRDLAFREALARGVRKKTRAYELLAQMLRDKEIHALERLFRVLDLLRLGESFERIYRGLQSRNAKARASSRELIENLVRPPLRDPLLAMVDDIPDAERLARSGSLYARPALEYDALVAALAGRGGALAMLARYHAAEVGIRLDTRASQPDEGAFAAGLAHAMENLSSRPVLPDAS
jgi:HEAT repeat protein